MVMEIKKIGRYEIIKEIGRGGMATVLLARDPRMERQVAVKLLPREFLHDPKFLERFNREAKTIAALSHSAIVLIHDFGEQGGQPYFIMQYMGGGSLAERTAGGPLPIEEAIRIITRLAPALDKAHKQGIIHRDLKPANIMFDDENEPCLADFGIAKIAQATVSPDRQRGHWDTCLYEPRAGDGKKRYRWTQRCLFPRGHPVRHAGRQTAVCS